MPYSLLEGFQVPTLEVTSHIPFQPFDTAPANIAAPQVSATEVRADQFNTSSTDSPPSTSTSELFPNARQESINSGFTPPSSSAVSSASDHVQLRRNYDRLMQRNSQTEAENEKLREEMREASRMVLTDLLRVDKILEGVLGTKGLSSDAYGKLLHASEIVQAARGRLR
jgi:hypothetical protein